MSLDNKIKTILANADVSSRQLAPALGISAQGAANRISRGITSIRDLIKICDYCEAKIAITTKDGTVIPLAVSDIDQNKK